MTDNKIEENAENWVSPMRKVPSCDSDTIALVKSAYIYGAHSRDEEIEELKNEASAIMDEASALKIQLDKLRNPWISVKDRLPEEGQRILVSLQSGAVIYDECFDKYRVNLSYVTNWMPIPELKRGE